MKKGSEVMFGFACVGYVIGCVAIAVISHTVASAIILPLVFILGVLGFYIPYPQIIRHQPERTAIFVMSVLAAILSSYMTFPILIRLIFAALFLGVVGGMILTIVVRWIRRKSGKGGFRKA